MGDARFSDGLVARFRVLCRRPIAVQVFGKDAGLGHERVSREAQQRLNRLWCVEAA